MTHPDHRVLDRRLSEQTNPLHDDPDAEARLRRLAELGLAQDQPHQRLDAFASDFARRAADLVGASMPDAMVNLLAGDHQYFAGLHAPAASRGEGAGVALRQHHTAPSRTMSLDTGWCPLVMSRRRPLVLDDVFAYRRFASNPAVDLGIRSYIGAPLLDPDSGIALGTVCATARDTRPYGRDGLGFIKEIAAEATALITGRAT